MLIIKNSTPLRQRMTELEDFIKAIAKTKTNDELDKLFTRASEKYIYNDESNFTLIQQACLNRKFLRFK